MSDVEQHLPNNNGRSTDPKKPSFEETVRLLRYDWKTDDNPGQARETLLLIAALIATVSFQAGINPPPYLFQSFNDGSVDENALGMMVAVTAFLVANSICLSTSLCIIDYLAVDLPFQRELRVSMISMVVAYGLSMGYTRPFGLIKSVLLSMAISMPMLLRLAHYFKCVSGLEQKTRRGSQVRDAS